ncbi:methyltransferase [Minwuia thermotolerans]|uniref:Methyltransferase n=1 Tax=Minwuia thermotolerans TaxID=2056226 RepID=A0A2M9G0W4_9PROT|nr:methyltransferase [Minwuia thermotolerans]PJK29314.1 methyltransferase [Minwuia thermotolerans]PJK30501.1 methyltransferase [Minwuia thermotolerans]PJK30724.1 methyltransferase [Minwuia thermotolerans]
MSQNRSSAVMAQRREPHDSLDFFPTPPWATRALIEHVLVGLGKYGYRSFLAHSVVWEPACGEDHMVNALAEYFGEVIGTDVDARMHGGPPHDFLMPYLPYIVEHRPGPHFVITNPPFRLAAEFVARGQEVAEIAVAMLVRTVFLEGAARYREIFESNPPLIFAPFSERVPMLKGRLDRKASSATSYAWFVWPGRDFKRTSIDPKLIWIPPCRKALERPGDYEEPDR